MTLETQEPITTIEPILGLGEDYEPETVWVGIVTGALASQMPQPTFRVYPSEADCRIGTPKEFPQFPLVRVITDTIERVRGRVPRFGTTTIALVDADLNIIRTWPV